MIVAFLWLFSSDTTGKFDLLDKTSGSFNERLLLLAVALKSINQSLYSLSLCVSAGAYELPCAYGAQQTTLGVSPHLQPCLRIFCLLFGEPASYFSMDVQVLFFISELISSYIYGKYLIHGAISPALCYMLLKLSFLCVLFYCVCVVCVCTCRYVWAWVYPGASRGHRHWIWSCSCKRCELPNLGAVNLDPLEQLLPLRVLSPVSNCIFLDIEATM